MKSREEIEKRLEKIEAIVKEKDYCDFKGFDEDIVQIYLKSKGFYQNKC